MYSFAVHSIIVKFVVWTSLYFTGIEIWDSLQNRNRCPPLDYCDAKITGKSGTIQTVPDRTMYDLLTTSHKLGLCAASLVKCKANRTALQGVCGKTKDEKATKCWWRGAFTFFRQSTSHLHSSYFICLCCWPSLLTPVWWITGRGGRGMRTGGVYMNKN